VGTLAILGTQKLGAIGVLCRTPYVIWYLQKKQFPHKHVYTCLKTCLDGAPPICHKTVQTVRQMDGTTDGK
jgi:hypothetical protein